MLPILASLVFAVTFALLTYLIYGLEGLTGYFWVGAVFWGLIASGLLVFLINRRPPCYVCRLGERLPAVARYCDGLAPCR